MRRALGRLRGQAAQLQHALRPRVAAQEAPTIRHRAAVDRLVEVLGREVEVARAKLRDHPRDLVHARSPARHAPTPAIHKPRTLRLVRVPKPPEMPFAHPQQLRRLSATQPTRLMQPNRIENPGHSDLLQHAIPPAETGQIVCYKTRTYRVSPTQIQAHACIKRKDEDHESGGISD